MFTQLAVILLGLFLIVSSQTNISSSAELVWGILVVVLVFVDFLVPYVRRPAP